MVVEVSPVIGTVAQELHVSEGDLIRQGVQALLESQLLQVNAQILVIHGKWGVSSVEEMDARYQSGALEEVGSWRDYQRLDHLEFERARLHQLIEALA